MQKRGQKAKGTKKEKEAEMVFVLSWFYNDTKVDRTMTKLLQGSVTCSTTFVLHTGFASSCPGESLGSE